MKGQLLKLQRMTQTLRSRPQPRARGNQVGGTWTFYVEPGVSRFLPLPGSFGSLRLRDPMPVQTTYPQNPGAAEGLIEGMRLVALRIEPMTMTAFQIDRVELSATIPDTGFARLLRLWVQGSDGRRDDRNYDARIHAAGPRGRGERGGDRARAGRDHGRGGAAGGGICAGVRRSGCRTATPTRWR